MTRQSTGSTGDDRVLARSQALARRAADLTPGGSQTGSKSPAKFVQGVSPTHIERAEGPRVWDADGNEYLEYLMSLGPVLLGHNYPAVVEAVEEQLAKGPLFSLESPLQVEAAERIVETVPCAEAVQFAKNGNDVTALAARVARAHTDREVIATQGYHGWPDVWMAGGALDGGVPDALAEYTAGFEYNDIESLERLFEERGGEVAAVVTTPVNLDPPEDGFLERVRELCDRHGALLVFDEILTGFRFAPGGAGEYFGVEPDLACFAKGMANGYPVSALAGREDVMATLEREDVFFSATYAGEALSLAATVAAVDVIRSEPVHDRIFDRGRELIEGIENAFAARGVDDRAEVRGYPCRFAVSFDDEAGEADRAVTSLFMQECTERGVLFAETHLPSYSHTAADVEETLAVYDEAAAVVADAIDAGDVDARLEGAPIGASLREQTGDGE